MLDIVYSDVAVTKLTANKQRITVKVSKSDVGKDDLISFLTSVGQEIANDPNIIVTMRGKIDKFGIHMYNDAKSFGTYYKFPDGIIL